MKKKILSFLLSFVLLISAFPLSAYASNEYFILNRVYTATKDYSADDVKNGGLTGAFPLGDKWCTFEYTANSSFSDNSYTVDFTDLFEVGCSAWSVINYIRLEDANNNMLLTISPNMMDYSDDYPGGTLRSYDNGSFKCSPNSNKQLKLNVTIYFTTNITSDKFNVSSWDYIPITTESETNSILSSIIDYIQEIIVSLSELPDKIKSFFTDLKNNISAWFDDVGEWFNELGDKLKQWFDDVGEWLTQLGDNLKQWFDDVGNWFSELFTNISNFFTDLWDGFIEWFKSLFVPRDGYFTELLNFFNEWFLAHFGFLAQAATVIYSLIETISNLDGTTTGIIIFPEIRLPFLDNPLLMEQQEFDLLSYINSISVLKQIYEIYQVIVTALFIFFFVKYAYRKFEEILKGREVTD